MKEIKLLIIDDDNEVLTEFSKSVERFNRDNQETCIFKVYEKKSLDEAKDIIKYYKIDTAIIDLNLQENFENPETDNSDGNSVVQKIIENFRIPIYILTGEPQKLALKYKNKNNITLNTKGEKSYLDLLKELQEKLSLKTIDYFSENGYLEKEINDFYWDNLQETLESWNDVARIHPTEIDKILSRHTVACLNEKLYVNGNIGNFDKYHPGEMYIIPPIKQHYHTGDIISKNNELFIILNPACDIVNKGKLNNYTLAKIIKALDIPKIRDRSEANKISYINDNLKRTNTLDQYHFLPSFNKIAGDFVIDFQQLTTVEIGTENKSIFNQYIIEREKHIITYERIASISSPFLKDIISRFALYYARQGQPNLL